VGQSLTMTTLGLWAEAYLGLDQSWVPAV